jgi:hypothetical protein
VENIPVTIAGNLRTMALADMMQWLSASLKSGVLVIDGPTYTKKIFFRKGDVVAVASDNPREMLGYYLVGWGYCTEEDLRYMIEMQDHFKVMLGELVVKLGHLNKEELDEVLIVKTREAVYDLLMWEEGDFRFFEHELPERDFLEVSLPVTSFLFEGARQRDERKRMKKAVPDSSHVPVLAGMPPKLQEHEKAIVALVDGNRSIERIALECRLPEFDVLSFAYRCIQDGILQLRPPKDSQTVLPGRSDAPWLEPLREVDDRLERGRFLDALKMITAIADKFSKHPEALEMVERKKGEIEAMLDEEPINLTGILEPSVKLDELVNLDCDPAEGFVLSRINGFYSLQEVLNQLPGSRLQNRVIVHNLLRRGLIKVREVTAVKPYRGSPQVLYHETIDDDPFKDD